MSSQEPQEAEHEDYHSYAAKIREYGRVKLGGNGYERIIFVNGCFDILHLGHVQTIAHARNLAGPRGAVVIGLNDDESVRRLKGPNRPVFDEKSRAILLLHIRHVDHVVTFSEDTPLELIKALRPDVIVKGGDYKQAEVVGRELAMVSIAPYEQGWSTSAAIKRMRKRGTKV
jgi:D-beta-D-heptose 7-phosphate kinase/D-beta-D-heptose 1-phosphate adenosyltransferase